MYFTLTKFNLRNFASTLNGINPSRGMSSRAALMIAALSALLCGCASVGHNFDSSAVDNLDLGQVKASEYRSIFGLKPTATQETTTADGRFEVAKYTYAHADLGTAKARTLILEFKDGTLNAFMYLSSFDEHQTHFVIDKLTQIRIHNSTKVDVLRIFGKPSGKASCPSTLEDFKVACEKCVEVWKWESMSVLSTSVAAYGGQPEIKSISISFDKDGLVSTISTGSLNNK